MKNLVFYLLIFLTIIIVAGQAERIIINTSLANDILDKTGYQLANDKVQTPAKTQIPTPVPTKEIAGDLLIDNISREMDAFHENGWDKLYESGEFDCSRMTTFMWDYLRNKYKIPPKLVVAPDREHAWLALRVMDVGETDRYEHWTIKNVDYYFLESTMPGVVKYENDVYFGDKWYASTTDFYTTRIFMADDPSDANTFTGGWSTEFRLTKPDIDKLSTFK
jgi:hypothetical protein